MSSFITKMNLPVDAQRKADRLHKKRDFKYSPFESLNQNHCKSLIQKRFTLEEILLSSLLITLSRYSGQKELSIGYLVKLLSSNTDNHPCHAILRQESINASLELTSSFEHLLQNIKNQIKSVVQNFTDPSFDFIKKNKSLESKSLPGNQILFFYYESEEKGTDNVANILKALSAEHEQSAELIFVFINNFDDLKAIIKYDIELFMPETIMRLIETYQMALKVCLSRPRDRIHNFEILSYKEKVLYQEINASIVPFNDTECIHELFERQVSKTPDHTAYVFEDSAVSYSEFNIKANVIANHLINLGVKPGVSVGLFVGRSLWIGIASMGILKSKGVYVPLDVSYPKERLMYMLQVSKPEIILTDRKSKELFPDANFELVCLETLFEKSIEGGMTINPKSIGSSKHPAYILFSSGTTGKPKGIQVSHRSFRNMQIAHQQAGLLDEQNRVLQFASHSFAVSMGGSFMAWLAGGTVYQVNDVQSEIGPELYHLLRKHEINMVSWPVSLLSVVSPTEFPALKTVISTAEPCTDKVVQSWATDGRRFINMYGCTEVAMGSTLFEWRENKPLTIGKPLANTQIYLLDDDLNQVPLGAIGEICIGGVALADGYVEQPEKTVERFISNPFSNDFFSDRLYKTGDLGRYLPNGEIQYAGRKDFQVNIHGFRVEVAEIENCLRSFNSIKEAAVTAKTDNIGMEQLVAYLVLTESSEELNIDEIRNHVSSFLPKYMVPSIYIFLESMPLTPNRKLDRLNFPEPDLSTQIEQNYVAPRNQTERVLADIWADALGVKQIGIKDNFFHVGGHSILAATIMSDLERQIGIEIPFSIMFSHPTIQELAQYIQSEM